MTQNTTRPPVLQMRLVVEVEDYEQAEPRETPWRSLNSRLNTPGGLQVTLFQELVPTTPGDNG